MQYLTVQIPEDIIFYSYREVNCEHQRSLLSHIPLLLWLFDNDIDYNWIQWKDLSFIATDKSGRVKKVACSLNNEWITLCRNNKSSYKIAWKSKKSVAWEEYHQLNNTVKRMCDVVQWSYISIWPGSKRTMKTPNISAHNNIIITFCT